jgi:hypothetical protein
MHYQLLRPVTTFSFSYVFATGRIINKDKLLKILETEWKSQMSTTVEFLTSCEDGTNMLMWLMIVLKNVDNLVKYLTTQWLFT